MSMELEAVIENFVQMLASDPTRSRQEIADLLNRWEEKGFISRQMRSVIIQRLKHIWDGTGTPSQDAQEQ
jgi:Cdc6-like AAA superfamily ATPase